MNIARKIHRVRKRSRKESFFTAGSDMRNLLSL
jgi:hypothetical protein